MEQSKAGLCLIRKVVDGGVTLIICVHVDDIVVAAKDEEMFNAYFAKLPEKVPVIGMDDLPRYLGCPFERHKMKNVVKMHQITFFYLLIFRYSISCRFFRL